MLIAPLSVLVQFHHSLADYLHLARNNPMQSETLPPTCVPPQSSRNYLPSSMPFAVHEARENPVPPGTTKIRFLKIAPLPVLAHFHRYLRGCSPAVQKTCNNLMSPVTLDKTRLFKIASFSLPV